MEKIYLATDHAGFELKEKIKSFLSKKGYLVEDLGADEFNKDDDYPDFVSKAAEAVSKDPESRGIVIGGSGQGEAMVANRYKNVRAVVYYGEPSEAFLSSEALAKEEAKKGGLSIIKLSREHNDSNVLSLGARFLSEDETLRAVELWLETEFSGEERHKRRIDKF